ncbi:MAG TPA: hypothetical protein VK932_30625 [Kofleriaceae bacterium]|nr:hypothetical protein [Kofleriaceae bacterium]
MRPPLGIFGLGSCLFEPISIEATREYRGFRTYARAGAGDRPSTMAAAAAAAALADAGVARDEVELVIFVGTTKDHGGGFSMGTELVRLLELGGHAVGLDVAYGCAGVLPGLDIARGWLAAHDHRYAIIVSAEQWSHTIARDDPHDWILWHYSDGAAAAVVGLEHGAGPRAATTFLGGVYRSRGKYTRRITMEHEEGAPRRRVDRAPLGELTRAYLDALGDVIREAIGRWQARPGFVVSTQMTPAVMRELAAIAGVAQDRVVITGHELGHLGSGDVLLGLLRLKQAALCDADILGVFHTPWATGAAVFRPGRPA